MDMDERPRVRLDYQQAPRVEKPVTTGIILGVILFSLGVAGCLLALLFIFRAR